MRLGFDLFLMCFAFSLHCLFGASKCRVIYIRSAFPPIVAFFRKAF